MSYSLKKMNLRTKFLTWSLVILTAFATGISTLYYFHLRKILMGEALNKSEVVLREVESIREYIKSVLRPKMYDLYNGDTFIIEAMSTTYISLNIMKRFGQKMPGYIYRRVSLNPHNPDNMADEFEEEMFDWFEEDRGRNFWQGIVRKGSASYFVSMVPDYFAKPCLHCHSDPAIAPKSLIDRYGPEGGFRFKVGDLAGVNSVSIPVSKPLSHIKKLSIVTFVGIIAIVGLLLFVLNLLFERLVISRITHMDSFFLKENEPDLPDLADEAPAHASPDELDSLKESLTNLNTYVRIARKGSGQAANFIGQYTVGKPVLAGSLTWLHQGKDSLTGDPVALKIPFEEIFFNPIYTACLRAEAGIIQAASHPNLIKIIDAQSDVLVTEALTGETLDSVINRQVPVTHEAMLSILRQLGDLVGYLHNMGVVHHDLRPQNMILSTPNAITLVDAGIAFFRDMPDAIFEAGLGPQGNFIYMAPEQLQGERGDPRSDIYSLGVWLYHLTTGKLPFPASRSGLKTLLRLKKEFKPSGEFSDNLSTELQAVILKAMSWDLDNRYQWVEDFIADLEDACGGKKEQTE
jgi:serine/threonine protein kinase